MQDTQRHINGVMLLHRLAAREMPDLPYTAVQINLGVSENWTGYQNPNVDSFTDPASMTAIATFGSFEGSLFLLLALAISLLRPNIK